MFENVEQVTFSDVDIYSAKLFKCLRDVVTKSLYKITYDFYIRHPWTNGGQLTLHEFFKKIKGKTLALRDIFGHNFIQKHDKNYKFQDECNIDLSSVFNFWFTQNNSEDIEALKLLKEKLEKEINELQSEQTEKVTAEILSKKEKKTKDHIMLKQKEREELQSKLKDMNKSNKFSEEYSEVFEKIKEIKDIRNKLCHDELCNEQFLISAKDKILKSLEKLYNIMKCKTKNSYDDDWKHDSKIINVIWKTQLEAKEIQEIQLLVNENLFKQFVSNCRKELVKIYSELNINVLGSYILLEESFMDFNISDVFTPVSLYHKNEKTDYEDLLNCKLNKKTTPAVVVNGNAGLGKTTLCRKLTYDWCSNTELSSDYDLLLHIEVRKTKQSTLMNYLRKILLRESLKPFKNEDIISSLGQCNVLFIVDGYDERSSDASKIVDEIMTSFAQKKYLITTRPEKVEDIFTTLKLHDILFSNIIIKGFEEENIHNYIDKIWALLKSKKIECGNAENFRDYLKQISPVLGDLLCIPLIIVILIFLWVEGKQKHEPIKKMTLTDLYIAVFDLMKQRIINKANEFKQDIELLKPKIDELLKCIARECYELVVHNKITISKDMVANIRTEIIRLELKDYMDVIYSSFFIFNPTIMKKNIKKMENKELASCLEFLHKTQMEYLTALYIDDYLHTRESVGASLLDGEGNPLKVLFDKNVNVESSTVFPVIMFMTGLYMKKNPDNIDRFVEAIMRYLRSHLEHNEDSYTIWWRVLSETPISNSETQYNNGLSSLLIRDILPRTCWILREFDVVSGLSLLSFLDITINELELHIRRPYCIKKIRNFGVTMANMKGHLCHRYDTRKPLIVTLRFEEDLYRGDEPNDNILSCLRPWGHLLKFMGYLGEDAYEVLRYCFKLKDLHVRFKSTKDMKNCVDVLTDKKWLVKFNLYIDIKLTDVSPNSLEQYPKLNLSERTQLHIIFLGAKEQHLDWIALVLQQMKPDHRVFDTVSVMKTNLEAQTVYKFVRRVNPLINKKLTIQSSKDISEECNFKITQMIEIIFDWIS